MTELKAYSIKKKNYKTPSNTKKVENKALNRKK